MKIRSIVLVGVFALIGVVSAGCCCNLFCPIPKCDPCKDKCQPNPCDPCCSPCAPPPAAPPAPAPAPAK